MSISAVKDISLVCSVVDANRKDVGKSEVRKYDANVPLVFGYHVVKLDIEGVSNSLLNNMGLLLATLHDGENEIFQLSMVVQVSKGQEPNTFIRNVLNPLE
jgi:hypothetical protein